MPEQSKEWYIAKAREMYTDNEHEFEDSFQPLVSISDEGAWVKGWFWVPNPEEDEDEEEAAEQNA